MEISTFSFVGQLFGNRSNCDSKLKQTVFLQVIREFIEIFIIWTQILKN